MSNLLEEVKTYLGIEGNEEDDVVTEIINAGIDYINNLTGMKLEYSEDGRPKDMLLDYCEKVYTETFDADEFKANYLDDVLLISVKNYLDITWHDPTYDNKLSGIIARGRKYIDNIAGSEMDYTLEEKQRELLFDYCRYVRSNALDEFQLNYQHELLAMQIAQEVKEYAEENPDI